ncbi:MAG: hypothetical protein Q4F85_12120 [Prevotella sp.]|nr:hypothetical protein [Prevotella sp.]
MKQNILKTVFVALAVALFASCTQNDDVLETIENGSSNETGYVYNLHLDGGAPVYSDDMTRASTTWKTGSEVSLRLKSGSSIIDGTAKFDGSNWKFTTDKKLSSTTTATKCGALYYENASGLNYLKPSSIVYMGEGTYTASSTDIYVSVTMKPVTCRLRFKGKSGTRITLEGDYCYLQKMSTTSSQLTWSSTTTQDKVELTVNSNGYTDYVYGTFKYNNKINALTIENKTEGKTYERRNIDGTIMSVGGSGFLTIPTSSNYASLGWSMQETIDQNATVEADNPLPLYDGVATKWNFGSSAYSFYSDVFKSSSGYKDDNEIIADLIKANSPDIVSDNKGYTFSWGNNDNKFFQPNTKYYLVAVAYNKNGERGPLLRQSFTTRSETEPRAIISNLKSNGNYTWQYDATLVNGAVGYYRIIWSGLNNYNKDDCFLVYWAYEEINKGNLSTFSKTSDSFSGYSDQCVVVLVAVDGKGNLCGYSVGRATTSTKSNVQDVSKQSRSKMIDMRIPKIIKSRRPEIR